MNHILCPECYARVGGEEKCCTHGCGVAVCTGCGKVRVAKDPYWSCIGSMKADEPHETVKLVDCAACAPKECSGHPLILRHKPKKFTMVL